jgi:penicillin amidase
MSLLRTGARGAELFRMSADQATVTVHALDPDADLDLIHGWVTQPRAAFWGMGGLTRDEVRDAYAFVETLPTHHAYLVRWDGTPVVLLQAYDAQDDPVAVAYDARPGDVGFHFFLGARIEGVADVWELLGPALVSFLLSEPGAQRLIAEPDARNRAAVARVLAIGFERGERVRFDSAYGPKDAQLVFLTRGRAAALLAVAWSSA